MPLKTVDRGRYYYLRGTVRGQYIYEATGIEVGKEREAEAARIKREAELLERSVYGPAATVTFREAAVMYCETARPSGTQRAAIIGRTLSNGAMSWNLVDLIGGKKLSEVNQELLDTLARKHFPASAPATIQRQLVGPVNAVLRRAAKRNWCPHPSFEHPKGGQSRVRWLTPEEAVKLTAGAAKHVRPLLVFLLGTGARISEAVDLDWRDVDLADARCRFWHTKNQNPRLARMPPAVVAALANLAHREGAVFRTHRGKAYADRKREHGGQIRSSFKTALTRSGIDHISPHGLRHTWASWFYAISRNALLLKEEGGWKSMSQVERYAHLVPSRYEDGIRAFWGGEHPAIRAESVQSDVKEQNNVL